ncbi:MAG: tripartite tricarboxylate transporter TctB family protein, partial [Lachnospiraceae bacterium]|nr:tripartite tricarboxylate transporter TctB family protein [Lachnospiraceae bacterium]
HLTEARDRELYEHDDELDRIPLEQEPTLTAKVNPNAKQKEESRNPEYGLGLTAMILGILSILGFCIPPLGLVLATVAFILGIVAAAKNNGKKMGVSGIIMGVIVLLSYLVTFIFFDGMFGMISRNQDRLTDTAWRRTTDGSVLYLYKDGTFIDVEQEGVFTDNFFSGTYDILSYEDTGLHFTGLEEAYNTDYAYDVYLYVNTYVSNGEEREDIAGTIRYLYLFERSYETGDAVDVCAHDSSQYGSVYPVKETRMEYPTIGNQYIAGTEGEGSDTEISEVSSDDITDTVTEEMTESQTETGESITGDTNVGSTETGSGSIGTNDPWGGIGSWIQDSKEDIEDFNASVSEEFEKNSENISSAMEDVSSAAEEASSAIEDIGQSVDGNSIWSFFQKIFQWIQDLFQ